MDIDTTVKLAVYEHFAETGRGPATAAIATRLGSTLAEVERSYLSLQKLRVLVLETDNSTIRMAPPFSGVPTQHVVESGGVMYHANCAWDALGIPAALNREAVVRSRCEQSGERLTLDVSKQGPDVSDWVFHCLVPAARWWENIVFT